MISGARPFRISGPSYQNKEPYLQTTFDVLFWYGMRYVDLQVLYDHPEWYMQERRAIHLPKEAQQRVLRIAPERYLHPLPPQLDGMLSYFFEISSRLYRLCGIEI